MKSIVLLMWITMPHTGETIYAPTSFYNDKISCEVKTESMLKNWPKERYSIKHKCLEITPEVIIDDTNCQDVKSK